MQNQAGSIIVTPAISSDNLALTILFRLKRGHTARKSILTHAPDPVSSSPGHKTGMYWGYIGLMENKMEANTL